MENFSSIINVLLLEAKDPKEYFEEHFGRLIEVFEQEKDDNQDILNHIKLKKPEIISIFKTLKTSDRINFFVPYIKKSILDFFYKSRINKEVPESVLKFVGRQYSKTVNKIEEGPDFLLDINNIKQTVEHYFTGLSKVQTIQNYTFGGKSNNYGERIDELYQLETAYYEKQKSILLPDDDDPKGSKILLSVEHDGFTYEWKDLNSSNCPRKEAQLMKHCGSNSKANTMFSLRRNFNADEIKSLGLNTEDAKKVRKPVLTFAMAMIDDGEYSLVESHGISNQKPDQKYHVPIAELLKTGLIVEINQSGSYQPENCFHMDDLDDDLREEIKDVVDIEIINFPRFTQEEKDRAQEVIDNTELPKFIGVYLEDSESIWGMERDEPESVNIVSEFYAEFKDIGLPEVEPNMVEDFTSRYRFKNGGGSPDVDVYDITLSINISSEYISASTGDNDLTYMVETHIETALEFYKEFFTEFLPALVYELGISTPVINEFTEYLEELATDEEVEIYEEDGVPYYQIEISTRLESDHGLTDFVRKLNKDNIFPKLLPQRTKPDYEQLELDLSSYRFEDYVDLLLETTYTKPSGRDWLLKIQEISYWASSYSQLSFIGFVKIDFTDIEEMERMIEQVYYVVENKSGRLARDLIMLSNSPKYMKRITSGARGGN